MRVKYSYVLLSQPDFLNDSEVTFFFGKLIVFTNLSFKKNVCVRMLKKFQQIICVEFIHRKQQMMMMLMMMGHWLCTNNYYYSHLQR